MKNRIKVIGIVIVVIALLLILIITGCFKLKGEKTILKAYEKSKITEDTKGYILDLRIYGIFNNKKINKIIRINNYKNTDYMIYKSDAEENIYLVKDSQTFINKKGKYEPVANLVSYKKTDSYLDTLKGIKKVEETIEKKQGELTYIVHEVKFDKKKVNEMLKDTDLTLTVDKDIEGEVWINPDGQIYKVYYKIDKLTIYASYFGYNTTTPVTIK